MKPLPPISALIERCRALAALDLILSPDWEYRYYSFNSQWAPGRQMASMRNGSGDEWFCLFHSDGWAAIKGVALESKAWSKGRDELSSALRSKLPDSISEFAIEPAFVWDTTSYVYYCLAENERWVRVNDETEFGRLSTGEDEALRVLTGGPQDYVHYASEYFEMAVPEVDVASLFSLTPITARIVDSLNPETDLGSIAKELYEGIGYPKQ